MTNAPIAFLDTETTSLRHDRTAWEIAVIRREPDGKERRLHLFLDDLDLADADPQSLEVGGYWQRHPNPRGQLPTFTAGKNLPKDAELVGTMRAAALVHEMTHEALIVGLCPNFDTETLGNLLRNNFLTPTWHYALIDVKTLALGYIKGYGDRNVAALQDAHPNVKFAPPITDTIPVRSDDVSRQCDVEPPGPDTRHTAMGDAEWVMRWWDKLTADHATTAPL